MKNFLGREAVYLLGFVAATVQFLTAFGLDISADAQTAVNAVAAAVVGVISAIVLKNGALGAALLQFAQAGMALAVGLGLDWSAEQQGKVMALVAALVAVWLRERVTAPVPAVRLEESSPLQRSAPRGV